MALCTEHKIRGECLEQNHVENCYMPEVVCTTCGYVGEPKAITKGSIAIEVVLWLCFLVPGLIYSIWRLSSRYDGCPSCGQGPLISVNSPMAQKFLRENLPEKLVAPCLCSPAPASSSLRSSAGAIHRHSQVLGRRIEVCRCSLVWK